MTMSETHPDLIEAAKLVYEELKRHVGGYMHVENTDDMTNVCLDGDFDLVAVVSAIVRYERTREPSEAMGMEAYDFDQDDHTTVGHARAVYSAMNSARLKELGIEK